MKKIIFKIISVICVFSLLISTLPIGVMAEENGKFINLSISGCDDSGQEYIKSNNVFYFKNDKLYAPISVFNDYTMYNYDKKNCAFVRAGQTFKKSNSKVVIDYENSSVNVYYSIFHKETYDMDIFSFSDTYFFPLSEMAAYLKSSVVHKTSNTISIISSGISICDALYDFSLLGSSFNYSKMVDDLFAGSEELYKYYSVLGYFGNTVFSFKISKLFGDFADYENYCDIIESAVTNTSVYDNLFSNKSALQSFSENLVNDFYNKLYKKAEKVYKLSSNSIVEMFNDYKNLNSFKDDSLYENFFVDEQIEIDKISSIGKKVKKVGQFLEGIEYLHNFYSLNDDNRKALGKVYYKNHNDNRGNAIKSISNKYNENLIKSAYENLWNEQFKDVIEETAEDAVDALFEDVLSVGKLKLATSVVNSAFKLAGFDLSENSSYNVLLAQDLVSYILNGSEITDSEKYYKISDSEDMRLTAIMILLIDIESYNLGNKVAKRIDSQDKNHYKSVIEDYENKLTLLYLASSSKEYDSVEGTKKIIDENDLQLKKLNLNNYIIDENMAKKYLVSMGNYIDAAIELIYNFPKYGFRTNDTAISIELIDLDFDNVPEILYCSHIGAAGIPTINGFYKFDGNEYKKCDLKLNDELDSDCFPILPKRDSNGTIVFVSDLVSNEYLEENPDRPDFASFWYYHSAGVSEFELINNTLSTTTLCDYSLLREKIEDWDSSDKKRNIAWNEYKSEVKKFNSEYIIDYNYGYTIAWGIGTGFIDTENLSISQQLDFYHNTMTKDAAEFIVYKYVDAKDGDFSFSDYFESYY